MNNVSRRGLIKTTAWTIPAITIASAAPAFATSNEVSCELKGWRTNHGHKGESNPKPGTHHYHISVGCGEEQISEVTIAGVAATFGEGGYWTAHNIRGGVNQPVIVSTDVAVRFNDVVRFQPQNPR